jgi:hypothetical protein
VLPFRSIMSAARWLAVLLVDARQTPEGSWISIKPYSKLNCVFSNACLKRFALVARSYPVRTSLSHKYTLFLPQRRLCCVVLCCVVVWCGVVWCGVVWCGVVWCGVVWCGAV